MYVDPGIWLLIALVIDLLALVVDVAILVVILRERTSGNTLLAQIIELNDVNKASLEDIRRQHLRDTMPFFEHPRLHAYGGAHNFHLSNMGQDAHAVSVRARHNAGWGDATPQISMDNGRVAHGHDFFFTVHDADRFNPYQVDILSDNGRGSRFRQTVTFNGGEVTYSVPEIQ